MWSRDARCVSGIHVILIGLSSIRPVTFSPFSQEMFSRGLGPRFSSAVPCRKSLGNRKPLAAAKFVSNLCRRSNAVELGNSLLFDQEDSSSLSASVPSV